MIAKLLAGALFTTVLLAISAPIAFAQTKTPLYKPARIKGGRGIRPITPALCRRSSRAQRVASSMKLATRAVRPEKRYV